MYVRVGDFGRVPRSLDLSLALRSRDLSRDLFLTPRSRDLSPDLYMAPRSLDLSLASYLSPELWRRLRLLSFGETSRARFAGAL